MHSSGSGGGGGGDGSHSSGSMPMMRSRVHIYKISARYTCNAWLMGIVWLRNISLSHLLRKTEKKQKTKTTKYRLQKLTVTHLSAVHLISIRDFVAIFITSISTIKLLFSFQFSFLVSVSVFGRTTARHKHQVCQLANAFCIKLISFALFSEHNLSATSNDYDVLRGMRWRFSFSFPRIPKNFFHVPKSRSWRSVVYNLDLMCACERECVVFIQAILPFSTRIAYKTKHAIER